MSQLAQLIDIDYTAEIDRLPRRPGHKALPLRGRETSISLHYSGVVYLDRSRGAELRRILSEAEHHLKKNWGPRGRPVIYGDGLMYDLVVLSDGAIVRTRRDRRQLWHVGNADGNRESWSVHVLLGPGQDLTPAQRASLFRLFDAIRADGQIARRNVFGHNEWPRGDGAPIPDTSYRLLAGQSECPGPLLHKHLVAYRALGDTPVAVPPYSGDSLILGQSRGTAEQAKRHLTRRARGYTAYDVGLIVDAYQAQGEAAGVDWFLAICQMAHETGSLTSWWCQRPRRNPAGIAVTGTVKAGTADDPPGPAWVWDGTQWREGLSFDDWRAESIPAQLGRLLAYALPAGAGTPHQQTLITYALGLRELPARYRGIAPQLKGLNGRWAFPGPIYGELIAKLAEEMRKA
jgi:hypothetical protein